MRFSILIIMLFSLVISCAPEPKTSPKKEPKGQVQAEQQKPAKVNKQAKQNRPNRKANQPVAMIDRPYWKGLRTELSLGKAQVEKMISIKEKYQKEIDRMRNTGKWVGAANKSNREGLNSRREAEYKKLLGNRLFKRKQVYDVNLNIQTINAQSKKK